MTLVIDEKDIEMVSNHIMNPITKAEQYTVILSRKIGNGQVVQARRFREKIHCYLQNDDFSQAGDVSPLFFDLIQDMWQNRTKYPNVFFPNDNTEELHITF